LKITLSRHGVTAVPPLAGFTVGNFNRSIIRSLTPQQAAGNALAIAGQTVLAEIKLFGPFKSSFILPFKFTVES